jgi:hypothetical protein
MMALDYKVRYAESSLQYLSKEYRRREMKAGPDGLMVPEPVPEEVIFHIDVFFSFMASALDFSGWILHLVFSTKLAETEIGLVNLVRHLTDSESGSVHPLLKELRTDVDTGWLKEFLAYRHFVNHWCFIVPHYGWKWTAHDKTVETTIFMLPDDPRVVPIRNATHRKRRELVSYCEEVLVNSLETINDIFGLVLERVCAGKST